MRIQVSDSSTSIPPIEFTREELLARLKTNLESCPIVVSSQGKDDPTDNPSFETPAAASSFVSTNGRTCVFRLEGMASILEAQASMLHDRWWNQGDLSEKPLMVIGLIKAKYEDSDVYITPTMTEVDALLLTGCEVIALDLTMRDRPKEDVSQLIEKIKSQGRLVMADCDSAQSIEVAINFGVDIVSTTMAGYTEARKKTDGPDIELVSEAKQIINSSGKDVLLLAEGRYKTPEEVKRAISAGASGVVIGGSINEPGTLTNRFLDGLGPFANAGRFGFHIPKLSPEGLLIEGEHTPDSTLSMERGSEVKRALGIRHPEARVWIHPRFARLSAKEIIETVREVSLGAHQDDELFLGIEKLTRGALTTRSLPDFAIVTLTNGVGSDRASPYMRLPDQQMFLQRALEQEIVGYNTGAALVINIPFASKQVKDPSEVATTEEIASMLGSFESLEVIYTHNPVSDAHPTHLAVASRVIEAIRSNRASLTRDLTVLGGEVWGSLDGTVPKALLRSVSLPHQAGDVLEALFEFYLSQIGTKNYPQALKGRVEHLRTLSRDASHVADDAAANMRNPGGRAYFVDMTGALEDESLAGWVKAIRHQATVEQLEALGGVVA